MDALMVRKRLAGSRTLVARSTITMPTALAESMSPAERSDTGAMAFRETLGRSRCSCRCLRSAPAHMAITASLRVPS